ncbi:MAG: CBS domain-containing protein [Betaproteobacteria bacterium]|nr:CBS domain-containing protein [Betaproteobacteria bacterium]
MPIGEVCTREVVIVEKSASIQDAAHLMRQYHVGDLVVVAPDAEERRVPVGILTDRDIIVELIAEGVDPAKVVVGDVMSTDLLLVREHDGIWETLQYMRTKGVRRAPVVDAGGGLVGIISADDMLELLADELNALASIIRREQIKENKTRR